MPIRITTQSSLAIFLAAAFLCACGPSQTSSAPSQSAGETGSPIISIKGSDTMVHLVRAWVDGYLQVNPNDKISVTGGGSGTGIAALLNGTTDICASSRDLDDKERQAAATKGLKLYDFTVARDALSIIVHPTNPVSELTLAQVREIYIGQITNWKALGGPDLQITVISRESSSGTYAFFVEHVLQKMDMSDSVMLLAATSQIVETVATTPGAIGYVGLGYAHEAGNRVKMLAIKSTPEAPAVMPSAASAISGEYSIARPLFLIVGREPEGRIKSFIDFCLSPEGQRIVEQSGYVRVN